MIKLNRGETKSQQVFESNMNNIFFWIIWFFELVGAAVIIIGALVCIFKYVQSLIKHKKLPLKILLANQLALGLEFMLVAEILKTVVTENHSLDEILVLAMVILLRAGVSILIHWELKIEEKKDEVDEKKSTRLAKKAKEDA